MAVDLEASSGTADDWSQLYRARGDEVAAGRPYFTGDVFQDAQARDTDGGVTTRPVIVVQHPCAMRINGVDLVPRLLVAEVRAHQLLKPEKWTGFTRVMPLPDLRPNQQAGADRHQAAYFNELHLVEPAGLGTRIACLSARGVNLLLQRWVHHNSRVVIPTGNFLKAVGGVFEEADLVEEWCEERLGLATAVATAECVAWLREVPAEGGPMRQRMLEEEQNRSSIRKQMRQHLDTLT